MAKKNVAAAKAVSRAPSANAPGPIAHEIAPPSVTYASAMDKLRDEMAKSKDNYTQVVGEYLTAHLLAHPEAEAALMDKDKSIKGSLEAVRGEAQKVRQGDMAVLDDRTVFGIVLNYFGIESGPDVLKTGPDVIKNGENVPAAITDAPGGTAGTSSAPDPFDLDALLGVM